MPREKLPDAMTYRVTLRFRADDMIKLKKAAGKYHCTISELVREAALKKRSPKKKKLPAELIESFRPELYHELRKQGVNLNQIAHHCNMWRQPPGPEFDKLVKRMLKLTEALAPER